MSEAGVIIKNSKFLLIIKYKKLSYEDYDFSQEEISDNDIDKYLKFVEKTGLKALFQDKKIKNLVDYTIGVEAGLDSNGRKNRGGSVMENIVEVFIKDVCEKNNFRYLKEANASKIKNEWGYDVPVDKSSRRYDFVINNGIKLFIIETNFYNVGGSKLKSTAGEYKDLFDVLEGYNFLWCTDGIGWEKTRKVLRETFDHNDYIFNLKMIEKGVLEFLLKQKT